MQPSVNFNQTYNNDQDPIERYRMWVRHNLPGASAGADVDAGVDRSTPVERHRTWVRHNLPGASAGAGADVDAGVDRSTPVERYRTWVRHNLPGANRYHSTGVQQHRKQRQHNIRIENDSSNQRRHTCCI